MRAVVSQQWLVVMPQTAMRPTPRAQPAVQVGPPEEGGVDVLGHE